MKKLVFLFVCLFSFQAVTKAADDKPIKVTELPKQAQTFITKYFADQKVAMAKMDTGIFDKSYEVMFTNGNKVEFTKDGVWSEVSCKTGMVPAAIVPSEIKQFVSEGYPDAKIVSIEKNKEHYEVNLSNGWEIKFDFNFNVIDLDN